MYLNQLDIILGTFLLTLSIPKVLTASINNSLNEVDVGPRMTYATHIHDLPYGNSPEMFDDLPGSPLTPTDFAYAVPILNVPMDSPDFDDPIELAKAFEGDIILANFEELTQMTQPMSSRNAVIQPDRVWPNREIPYVISSTYNREERGTIAVAMRNFHLKTCLKFVPRTKHTDYIHIHKGSGCSSSVGRVKGHQSVSLGHGCIYVGIAMHELMHAAGFWHEQSRFDRDDYVRINWSNIKNGMDFNFQKYDWKTISHLDMNYDLGSIMHYGAKSFAKDRTKNTIESLTGGEIGQRRAFSVSDIEKINKLYKCDQTGYNKVTTTTARPITTGGAITSPSIAYGGCKDDYNESKCQFWSKSGQCQKNPDWMLVNCKKSCNTCKQKCADMNTNCDYWSRSRQCTQNTAYMHVYCKKSCGLCHAPGDDTKKCIDQNEYCEPWAASGTCHSNTAYMTTYCKKSCTDCDATSDEAINSVMHH